MNTFRKLEEKWIEDYLERHKGDFHSKLESFEMYKERKKRDIFKNLDSYQKSYNRGYALIIDELKKKYK